MENQTLRRCNDGPYRVLLKVVDHCQVETSNDLLDVIIPFEGARYDLIHPAEVGMGSARVLGASDILIVPKNRVHAINWQRPAGVLWLQLSTDFLKQILGSPAPPLQEPLVLRDRFLSDTSIELRRAVTEADVSSPILGAFIAMIAFRIGRCAETGDASINRPIRPLSTVERERVERYIERNLDRPIRIAELAGLIGMSQWHFLRRFSTGESSSPNSFITQRRIDKACALLTQSTLSVTNIALEVGMSPSHLSRTFLQRMGVSPRMFRQGNAS